MSRDGLFDTLPEYLFLKPIEDHNLNSFDKQEILEFNKQQQINCNILFNPIKHAILEQKVAIENFENEMLYTLTSYNFSNFQDFWRIDMKIPEIYRIKLVKLMPYIYSVTGNFTLTAKCLSFMTRVIVL